jgi:hypothetical protein
METLEAMLPRYLEGDEKLAQILVECVAEFRRLDRYERRALSRRKTAFVNLMRVAPTVVIQLVRLGDT